ncbi:MAG: hypothetical protein ACPGR8_03255, partial [Limisphaerales bacterium]
QSDLIHIGKKIGWYKRPALKSAMNITPPRPSGTTRNKRKVKTLQLPMSTGTYSQVPHRLNTTLGQAYEKPASTDRLRISIIQQKIR